MILKENELKKISGGGISATTAIIVSAAITFITGIIDGFLRPIKCN